MKNTIAFLFLILFIKANAQKAKPHAVVAATKMNVLYWGLDNPISVSVTGVKQKDIQVRCEGCYLMPMLSMF